MGTAGVLILLVLMFIYFYQEDLQEDSLPHIHLNLQPVCLDRSQFPGDISQLTARQWPARPKLNQQQLNPSCDGVLSGQYSSISKVHHMLEPGEQGAY